MKIGVISDTHDQVLTIEKAVEIFNEHKVKKVYHCGDWVAPFTLKFYEKLNCPLKGVFGNNDGDRFIHAIRESSYPFELNYEERFLEDEIEGRKIAVFHGDYAQLTNGLIKSGDYDAVFHGHTHIKVNELVGDTLSLNPGSLVPVTNRKKGIQGQSIAIYDTKSNTAKHIDL